MVLMRPLQTTYTGTNLDSALKAMGNGGVANLAAWRDEVCEVAGRKTGTEGSALNI